MGGGCFGRAWSVRSEKALAPTPVLLPGKSQGRESLVGCHLWGHAESDTTEATAAAAAAAALNIQINLGRIDTLTTSSFPIHERGISLHLLV